MKKLLLIVIVVLSTLVVKAQDAAGVVNALKLGNANQVSEYFDKILDLKLPDKEEIKSISKNQAGIALKSFFENNNLKGFELSSQREMGGTMYIAGKLTNGEEGYKISIILKNRDGKLEIISIRISS